MSVQTDFPIGSRIIHQHPTRGTTQVIVTGRVVAHGSYGNIFVIPDTISDIYGTPSAGPDRNAYNMSAKYCTLETTGNPEEYKKTKLLNKIHDLDKRWKLQQEAKKLSALAKKLSALATAPVQSAEAETTSQHIAMDTNGALAVGFTGTGSGT